MTETSPHFRYYDVFATLAVAVLIISNTIAQKLFMLGPFTVSVAILLFPVAYLLSDILTEVYGYQRARRVTWMMVTGQILMVLFYEAAIRIPPINDWPHQEAFKTVLGSVPRISIASVLAIWAGDMVNCYILSKMKIWTKGRHLWARVIGSTFAGQGVDSLIFYTIAFVGAIPYAGVANAIVSGWLLKTLYEALLYPITLIAVKKLKKIEGIDHYDHGVDYTPFSLKVDD